MTHPTRLAPALAIVAACQLLQEPPGPIEACGTVYEPERLWPGGDLARAAVANATVGMADLGGVAPDVSDARGRFCLSGVPANFNSHPVAEADGYARTIDAFGVPVTSSDVDGVIVPILRDGGGLHGALSDWIGRRPERGGALVVGVTDAPPPRFAFVREGLSFAVGPSRAAVGLLLRDAAGAWTVADPPAPGEALPEGFTGMVAAHAASGEVVRIVARDASGRRSFAPHPMPVVPDALLFMLYVPE